MKKQNVFDLQTLTESQKRVLDLIALLQDDTRSPGFDMSVGRSYTDDDYRDEFRLGDDPRCGTACCIFGHQYLLGHGASTKRAAKSIEWNDVDSYKPPGNEDLYYPVFCDAKGSVHAWTDSDELTKEVGVEVLTHYLQTWLETGEGVVDWRRAHARVFHLKEES